MGGAKHFPPSPSSCPPSQRAAATRAATLVGGGAATVGFVNERTRASAAGRPTAEARRVWADAERHAESGTATRAAQGRRGDGANAGVGQTLAVVFVMSLLVAV